MNRNTVLDEPVWHAASPLFCIALALAKYFILILHHIMAILLMCIFLDFHY